ncbi:hypothetical protein BD779DRAFT_1222194 [Infundibulicybe gibba]|nr:hypothetical protein BD779DRAFT_1222194 [Infundibulicybe gibba]
MTQISPNIRYTIKPDASISDQDVLVHSSGANQNLVINSGAPVQPNSNQWELVLSSVPDGGVTMKNVAFGSYLKASDEPGTPVTTTESSDRAWTVQSQGTDQDAEVVIKPADGSKGQLWRFTPILPSTSHYIIKPDASISDQDVLVRSSGANQNLVVNSGAPIQPPNSDQWIFTPGKSGGSIMQNIAFKNYLKASNESGTPVTTTETSDEATSFAVTPAGDGKFHVKIVANNSAWTVQSQGTGQDSKVVVKPADGSKGQLWRVTYVE